MTWVKIDDALNLNPKVRGVSLAARWTYISSICRAGATMSDGIIKRGDLSLLDATPKIAHELEAANLWESHPDGWYIHDYLVYNRSRAQTEEMQRINTENGRRGLANRYANRQATTLANRQADGLADGLANARSLSLSSPTTQLSPGRKKEKRDTASSEPASESLEAPKRTKPTKEWADEMREKYALRDFDETLKFYMNQGYYRTCTDKCAYLEGKLKASSERERGNVNGTRPNTAHRGDSQQDPELQRLRALGIIIE